VLYLVNLHRQRLAEIVRLLLGAGLGKQARDLAQGDADLGGEF
jgi:hypothetical protein